MLTTWNVTSTTPQGYCHIKNTNLCNEEKKKPNCQHRGIQLKDQTKK
jgi:hypothetical protein